MFAALSAGMLELTWEEFAVEEELLTEEELAVEEEVSVSEELVVLPMELVSLDGLLA